MGKNKQSGFNLVVIVLLILVVAGAGFAGWKIYKKEPKYQAPTTNNTTSNNIPQSAPPKISKQTVVAPSADELSNIQASITSGNTAALEGYMAASVNVILAASEAYGAQTPVQAVKDVDYVSAGTNWDFALPDATLTKYRAGFYKQYFPTGALIGKSSNGYVISFQFDNAGKINGIFMTNSESVL